MESDSMRILGGDGCCRVIEKFLLLPKRLAILDKRMTRLRWLSQARIVQTRVVKGTLGCWVYSVWEDFCFLEDVPAHHKDYIETLYREVDDE